MVEQTVSQSAEKRSGQTQASVAGKFSTIQLKRAAMKKITTHYIDGAFVESHRREVMDIVRPIDGQVIARVTLAVLGSQQSNLRDSMSRSTFEEQFAELARDLNALEAQLANSEMRKQFADVERRIEVLYETLRENCLLLETVLENSAASVYAKRKDGRYLYINHEMEVLCNVAREQVLGKTDFEVFPREIAQQWRTNDLTAMTTRKLTVSEETIDTPRGERLVLSKKVPLTSASGEVEGICGISTDITDLRKTELALRETIMALERERENKLMNVDAITASIAHEVKQPLTAIAANASSALRFSEKTPPDYDEVRAALSRIIRDSRRASEVFDSIRALFRKTERAREPIDVSEITREVLQSLRGELKDHGVETHTELAAELPPFRGHKSQLQQVIVNLVHNAIEAMDTTTDRSRVLRLKTELRGGDAIIFAVEDSGPGIDPTQLDEIFEAFVTTKADGMGLGLAICRTIIQSHGGELSVLSDGKNGALFQFVLPTN
jgi:PAS domain S-box-containing protein